MDDDLIVQAQKGSREAMGKLLSLRHEILYRTALGILSSPQDAEDAVQETALKAWLKIRALEEREHFNTWLMRVLINTCRDMLRKRSRQKLAPGADLENVEEPDRFQDWLIFMDTVSALEQRQREIVVLRFAWHMTFKEIASITGQHEATVKYQLKKALHWFRCESEAREVLER